MDTNKRHFLLRFFEWDLTATIAGTIALMVIVGFGYASAAPLVQFDFQGAAIDNIVSKGTPVMGSLDLYPAAGPNNIVYGWTNSSVQEYSDQDVTNKLKRDSNASTTANTFKIAGLVPQTYTFRFNVGSSDIAMSTKVVFGSQLTTSMVTKVNEWVTKDVVYEVSEDPLTLDFSSGDGETSWGIAGLTIYVTDGPIIPPTFDMTVSPASVSMFVGNSIDLLVGITPDNNYTYSINFSVSDLPAGMKAEFNPTKLTNPTGSTTLTLSLSSDIAPTTYSITLRATGGVDDPESVTKTTAINVIAKVFVEEEEKDEKEDEEKDGEEMVDDIIDKPDEVKRIEESIRGFELISLYIEEVEDTQLVIEKELEDITKVANEFAAFPVVALPPLPRTSTESALQTLTALGIIDMVVSNAPPGRKAPKIPPSMWQQFLSVVFNEAG